MAGSDPAGGARGKPFVPEWGQGPSCLPAPHHGPHTVSRQGSGQKGSPRGSQSSRDVLVPLHPGCVGCTPEDGLCASLRAESRGTDSIDASSRPRGAERDRAPHTPCSMDAPARASQPGGPRDTAAGCQLWVPVSRPEATRGPLTSRQPLRNPVCWKSLQQFSPTVCHVGPCMAGTENC